MEKEEWKSIPNYEGLYEVSSLGRVKSLKFGKEKILKLGIDGRGYYKVDLYKNVIKKARKVHSLVSETFLNHIPCRMELVIDHINDIKSDNRVENLQIVPQRFNVCKTQGRYSSKYKGVCWCKTKNKWLSKIKINGKYLHLGYFTNEEEASQAYQNKLKEIL